jgi:hypothetical protein
MIRKKGGLNNRIKTLKQVLPNIIMIHMRIFGEGVLPRNRIGLSAMVSFKAISIYTFLLTKER